MHKRIDTHTFSSRRLRFSVCENSK